MDQPKQSNHWPWNRWLNSSIIYPSPYWLTLTSPSQLREIILSHEETFLDVLQGSTSCKSLESLRELSVVTSVVCLLRPRYEDPESVTDESKKARGFLSKLQRILLGLMQTFLSKDFCDQVSRWCLNRLAVSPLSTKSVLVTGVGIVHSICEILTLC